MGLVQNTISSFILKIGFVASKADTWLFIFHQNSNALNLLVYIDHLVLPSLNPSLIDTFVNQLKQEFLVHDLGSLHYFLGLEV